MGIVTYGPAIALNQGDLLILLWIFKNILPVEHQIFMFLRFFRNDII